MDDGRSHLPCHEGVAERGHRQCGGHTGVHGVPDDPIGEGVLDGAQVDLSLAGPVLGDVGEPQHVGGRGGEDPLDQVVVDGRAWPAVHAPFLGVHRPDALH